MFSSLALGFGLSAAVIAANSDSGGTNAGAFLQLVALAYALSLSMLSIGFVISAVARSAGVASAIALFLWLILVFVGDLGLMGSALAFKLRIQDLFAMSLINPLQVFKMASLSSIHASLDVLGPAGLYAVQRFGASLNLIFAAVLAAWIVVPLAVAHVLFLLKGGAS
jgi:Cu-processing system permease protein